MASIRLVDITRQYASQTILDRVSLTVPQGEFWVLVGQSGCGKSTLLRSIAGLEPISSGELYIGDRLMNNVPARDRDVAMVFQNYALYPHMSVADNLAFGLKMRKAPAPLIKSQVQRVAQMLDIGHLLDRTPPQLSGGQQQRVALGRAIVRQPQVFLLDEPLSNLDAQLRDETRAELQRLHQQVGITTLYVTHDQQEAMTLADRLVVLAAGQVQQIGSPQEVYDRPANRFVATFLGSPTMNIWPARYQEGQWWVAQQPLELGAAYGGYKTLDLGLRPEHLSLTGGENFLSLIIEVTVVEPLGRETLVKGIVEGSAIPVDLVLPATWAGGRGDRFPVYFDRRNLLAFERDSGLVIRQQKPILA